MKKQYKVIFYMQCCLTIFYLNAAAPQGWWNWATSLADRARAHVVQEYLPSGLSLSASLVGSGVPGALVPAAWVYRWGKQPASEPQVNGTTPRSLQLGPTQSPVNPIPRSSSASDLQKLAATTRVAQSSTLLPQERKNDVTQQASTFVALQQKSSQRKEFPKIPYPWAVAELQGRRKTMEDAHVIKFKYPYLIAAVYDGHGGSLVARTLAKGNSQVLSLHKIILQKINQPNVDIKQALKDSFIEFDKALQWQDPEMHTGSTAVVLLLNIITGNGYCAWVGDSRGLIIDRKSNMMATTLDHKPSNQSERDRVKKAGGKIIKHVYGHQTVERVYRPMNVSLIPEEPKFDLRGGLNMTRAFGDFYFARKYNIGGVPPVISAEPDVISFKIKTDHYTIFLGCDGIFEPNISNEDIARMISIANVAASKDSVIKTEGNSSILEKKVSDIVRAAYDKGSTDNMTALIIDVSNK